MPDAFDTRVLHLTTGSRETVRDLTADCASFLDEVAAGRDGLLNIFVPHATAGIAVLETGAGSDDDLLAILQTLLPADHPWHHRHGTRATAATTSSRPSSHRMPRSRSSTGGWSWGLGSRCAWSTRTWTTPTARCG